MVTEHWTSLNMIFIYHLIFSIIVFTQFDNSLEQPRSFDLNKYPTIMSTQSVTDDQAKLEMSFLEFYENDQHKKWPELQYDILKHNIQKWGDFCLYLFKKTEKRLQHNITCEAGKYETSNRGFKIVYRRVKNKLPIYGIDMLKCFCNISPAKGTKPDYTRLVTKYSDSQYFVADQYKGEKIWKLIKFVRNVPASLTAHLGFVPRLS